MRLKLLVISICLCKASISMGQEGLVTLKPIPAPKATEFTIGDFDTEKDEILGWVADIESFLATTAYDCKIRSELVQDIKASSDRRSVAGWSHSFRLARSPNHDVQRIVSIRQDLFGNVAIAENTGFAYDQRHHIDLFRDGEKVYSSALTAFESNVGEEIGEGTWIKALPWIREKMIFDPCLASIVSPHQISMGYGLEFEKHNFREHSVVASINRNGYVHVLLKFGVSKTRQVASFRNSVPVQLVSWRFNDETGSNARTTGIVQSIWKSPQNSPQLLPVRISSSCTLEPFLCELTAEMSWEVGDDVDPSLFDRQTLGFLTAHPDEVPLIPLLQRE